jgi:hypothetical protein
MWFSNSRRGLSNAARNYKAEREHDLQTASVMIKTPSLANSNPLLADQLSGAVVV